MHSENTAILDMSAAARVERRHEERKQLSAVAEEEALTKLLQEGWHIEHDNDNWVATKGEHECLQS